MGWAVPSPLYELESAQVRSAPSVADETRDDRHPFASQLRSTHLLVFELTETGGVVRTRIT